MAQLLVNDEQTSLALYLRAALQAAPRKREVFRIQISLKPSFPKPQAQLCHSHRLRTAQFSEPIENGGSDMQLIDLPLERT